MESAAGWNTESFEEEERLKQAWGDDKGKEVGGGDGWGDKPSNPGGGWGEVQDVPDSAPARDLGRPGPDRERSPPPPSRRGDDDRRDDRGDRRRFDRSRSPPRRGGGGRYRSRSRSFSPRRERRPSPPPRRERRPSPPPRPTNVEPSTCLGVFGLSRRTDERDLERLFGKYGSLDKVTVVYDHRERQSRGFGFITFDSVENAARARDETNGIEVDGRNIRVDFSVTKKAHDPTPGFYAGRPTRRDDRSPPRGRRGGYRSRSRSRQRSPYGRRRDYSRSPRR